MKKTMMYLPEEMHRYLAREAESRGLSMAQVAREAIAEYRTRRKSERGSGAEAIFGILDDTDAATDLAHGVDQVLSGHFAEGGAWDEDHGRDTAD